MNKQIEFYENKLAYEMDPSDLFAALENGEEVVALDTRQTFGYEAEHIPTAINIPHREMTAERTQHLDKSKTYIFHNETFSIFFDSISFKIGTHPTPSQIDLKVYNPQLDETYIVEKDTFQNIFLRITDNSNDIWGPGTHHLNISCNNIHLP